MGSLPIGLSASRGSAILGLSRYKSALVAWLEIMESRKPGFCSLSGYKMPERIDPWKEPLDPKTAPLRWGLGSEGAICEIVGGITDREKAFSHPDHDFITCHIDGLKNGNIQENKTAFDMAFKMGWGEPESDMIPIDYQVQVQHQMMCSNIRKTDVNVLVFPKAPAEWEKQGYAIDIHGNLVFDLEFDIGTKSFAKSLYQLGFFHHYHTESNPTIQKEILDRYLCFWNDNVSKETPPPVNGYDDIKWLIPSPEGEIEANERIRELWSELVDIENEADSGKLRVKTIKDEIAKFMQSEVPKKSAEKGKLCIYAGSQKLASWSGKQFRINRPKKD